MVVGQRAQTFADFVENATGPEVYCVEPIWVMIWPSGAAPAIEQVHGQRLSVELVRAWRARCAYAQSLLAADDPARG